jgi:hypothetical protein
MHNVFIDDEADAGDEEDDEEEDEEEDEDEDVDVDVQDSFRSGRLGGMHLIR